MNKVILVGNLTKDPELIKTPNNINFSKFNLAVQRKFKNSNGENDVDFFSIIAWRVLAENCYKYLKKGSKISIVGNLQTRSYEDKDNRKRLITEVVAEEIEFISTKKNNGVENKKEPVTESINTFTPINDDDLPF